MDNKIAIVWANGSGTTALVTVCKTLDNAKNLITKILGTEPEIKKEKLYWKVDSDKQDLRSIDPEDLEEDDAEALKNGTGGINRLYDLFKHAYFGCGGPTYIIAEEIEMNKVGQFGYDLD